MIWTHSNWSLHPLEGQTPFSTMRNVLLSLLLGCVAFTLCTVQVLGCKNDGECPTAHCCRRYSRVPLTYCQEKPTSGCQADCHCGKHEACLMDDVSNKLTCQTL